jgi:uncharacterized protein (TIRG00374 family)
MSKLVSNSSVESSVKAPAKRNWKGFVVRIIGSILVLASLLYFLPRDSLTKALGLFSIEIWMAGIVCYLCLHLIGAAKWRMLINAAGGGLTFLQAARCYYYGLFGNTFLPSVVGGDIIRAGLAFRLTQSKSAVILGGLVDRTIDSLGLALVAGLGVLFIPMSLDEGSRNVFFGFAIVMLLLVALLVVVMYKLPVQRLSLKWRRRLVKIRGSARLLTQRPSKVLVALLAVVVLQTSQVVMNCWLGRLALMMNASFFTWLFVWPIAKLSAMAPLTQGGIGVREAVQGTLFVPFGVSMEQAVAAGLMFQAIIICGNLLGGLLAMVLGQASPGFLKPVIKCTGVTYQWVVYGGIAMGLTLFFVANVLMLAWGSGAIGEHWIQWMVWLPGYDISFVGSTLGLVYGLIFGSCLGYMGSYSIKYFKRY